MPITKDEARARAGMNGHNDGDAVASALPVLSFDDIMAAEDAGEKAIPIPQWGGAVVIKGLTRTEFLAIQKAAMDKVPGKPTEGKLNEGRFEELLLEAVLVQPKLSRAQVTEMREKKGVAAVGALFKGIMAHLGAGEEASKEQSAAFPESEGSDG